MKFVSRNIVYGALLVAMLAVQTIHARTLHNHKSRDDHVHETHEASCTHHQLTDTKTQETHAQLTDHTQEDSTEVVSDIEGVNVAQHALENQDSMVAALGDPVQHMLASIRHGTPGQDAKQSLPVEEELTTVESVTEPDEIAVEPEEDSDGPVLGQDHEGSDNDGEGSVHAGRGDSKRVPDDEHDPTF